MSFKNTFSFIQKNFKYFLGKSCLHFLILMIIHSRSSTSSLGFDPVKPNKLSMSKPKL